jgi:hypothetical protein
VFNDPARFHLELDLSAMLRGDFATQAQVGINLVRAGVATPTELREQLGMNPSPRAIGGRRSAVALAVPATARARAYRRRVPH